MFSFINFVNKNKGVSVNLVKLEFKNENINCIRRNNNAERKAFTPAFQGNSEIIQPKTNKLKSVINIVINKIHRTQKNTEQTKKNTNNSLKDDNEIINSFAEAYCSKEKIENNIKRTKIKTTKSKEKLAELKTKRDNILEELNVIDRQSPKVSELRQEMKTINREIKFKNEMIIHVYFENLAIQESKLAEIIEKIKELEEKISQDDIQRLMSEIEKKKNELLAS